MASIQQAAKWLEEGKRVKREGNNYVFHSLATCQAVILHERSGQTDTACFLTSDLLADDWEIANTNED